MLDSQVGLVPRGSCVTLPQGLYVASFRNQRKRQVAGRGQVRRRSSGGVLFFLVARTTREVRISGTI